MNGNLSYIEISAKNGTKINSLFLNMAKILENKAKDTKVLSRFIKKMNSPLPSKFLNQKMKQMKLCVVHIVIY